MNVDVFNANGLISAAAKAREGFDLGGERPLQFDREVRILGSQIYASFLPSASQHLDAE